MPPFQRLTAHASDDDEQFSSFGEADVGSRPPSTDTAVVGEGGVGRAWEQNAVFDGERMCTGSLEAECFSLEPQNDDTETANPVDEKACLGAVQEFTCRHDLPLADVLARLSSIGGDEAIAARRALHLQFSSTHGDDAAADDDRVR